MLTSSCKNKARLLQKHVVAVILEKFPELQPDDVTSRSMGCGGEDILFSPKARGLLGISVECKNRAAFAIYKDYEQALDNSKGHEPVLIIKQNRSKPLAVIDLDYYLSLLSEINHIYEDLKRKPNS